MILNKIPFKKIPKNDKNRHHLKLLYTIIKNKQSTLNELKTCLLKKHLI